MPPTPSIASASASGSAPAPRRLRRLWKLAEALQASAEEQLQFTARGINGAVQTLGGTLPDVDADAIDPDALREKYAVERDKRMVDTGSQQYVRPIDNAAMREKFVEDPWIKPTPRDALSDHVQVAVIGGGFGALVAGARLRERGVQDLRLVEKGGDFGGTWYWNRYPGAMCDVESYVYMPLIEEIGRMPSEKYSHSTEIYEHSRAIAEHYDLYRNSLLSTGVSRMEWSEEEARWTIHTDRGDAFTASFAIINFGTFAHPKLPGVEGVDSFEGHMFHTSRWDYDYTGGSNTGGLTGLNDKRVAVIGTGATAVQVVPHVAADAKQLYVVQRTPSSIGVRNNARTDPEWVASLEPGWQKERIINFTSFTNNSIPTGDDLVNDGWTDIMRNLQQKWLKRRGEAFAEGGKEAASEVNRMMEFADFEQMERLRQRIDDIVEDPATAEALKPWYRQFCKRPVSRQCRLCKSTVAAQV